MNSINNVACQFIVPTQKRPPKNHLIIDGHENQGDEKLFSIEGRNVGIDYTLDKQSVRVFLRGEHQETVSAAIGVSIASYLKSRNGLLMHAAFLRKGGMGFLLVGPSGAGKSTLCASTSFECVHDDKAAVRLCNGVWKAYGVPLLNNNRKGGLNKDAILSGLFILNKANVPGVRRLSPTESVASLSAQILLPDGVRGVNTYQTILDMVFSVPVYRLSFCRNTRFEELLYQCV